MNNIYQPDLMEVVQVKRQTADVKTVRIRFRDEEKARNFSFRVGQFGIFSVFGAGESTFNLCSSSNWKDFIEFCFRRTGRVTEALWNVEEGDTIGFRGPYGNAYPMDKWKGKNLIFIGGGIAMPPIRCAIWYALDNRADFGQISIVYGARTVGDLVFRNELARWAEYERVKVVPASIPAAKRPTGTAKSVSSPRCSKRRTFPAEDTAALVIGPPVMIKFSLPVLAKMGIADRNIFTSLENRMKCGLGKCGRCNCGPVYVCKEGPVFTMAQLKSAAQRLLI